MKKVSLVVLLIPYLVGSVYTQNDNCFGNSYEILQDFEVVLNCPTEDWKLVFYDEFNGTQLNENLWYTYSPSENGDDQFVYSRTHPNEGQIYLDENVAINNGSVKLIARRENVSWFDAEREFSSGKLHSRQNFRFNEGRFEIRCKVPQGQGFWPAFWLFRFGDEIDVFEIGGDNSEDYLVSIHTEHGQVLSEHCRRSETIPVEELFKDFHTYSVEWEETEIRWKFDGEVVYRMPKYTEAGINELARYCPDNLEIGNYLESLFFSQFDMEVLVNLAIPSPDGNSFTDYPDSSTVFPSQMEIDYVRVYQRNPQNDYVDQCESPGLIGPTAICGVSPTYQYQGPFDQIIWETSSNFRVDSVFENQITVTPISTGTGFVRAVVDSNGRGPCSARTETVDVQVAQIISGYQAYYQNGNLTIMANCQFASESLHITIYDLSGRMIATKNLSGYLGQYQTSIHLETGIYLARLTGDELDQTIKVFVP